MAFGTRVTYNMEGTATEGTDYASVTTKSVVIPAGETRATVTINPTDDGIFEANETIVLTVTGGTTNNTAILLAPVTGEAVRSATGTITNDDAAPTASVTVAPAAVAEDATGAGGRVG